MLSNAYNNSYAISNPMRGMTLRVNAIETVSVQGQITHYATFLPRYQKCN